MENVEECNSEDQHQEEQMETDIKEEDTKDAVKDDDIVAPPHPYKEELSQFKPDCWQLEEKEPQMYSSLEESKFTMVDSQSLLEEMMTKLKEVKEMAVNLMRHSYRSFRGMICLVQISTWTDDFIIDPLILKNELDVLNEVFTDSSILKVLHGSDRDIEWLQKDLGVFIINMFDTQKAARVLREENVWLSHILKKYCKVEVNKDYQRADWRVRPLPDNMVKYAREDSHYLLYVHEIFRNSLLKRSIETKDKKALVDVYTACTSACGVVWHPEKHAFRQDSYLACLKRIKGKLNVQQLECFRLLYEWKHRISKERDESTGYTLPNKMMLKISKSLPKKPEGIAGCCVPPVPPLVQEHLEDIHKLVLQAIINIPEVPKEATHVKKITKGHGSSRKSLTACLACGRLGHHVKDCLRTKPRGGAWNYRGRSAPAPYGAYPGGPAMRGGTHPGFQNYHGRGPRHMHAPNMHPYGHPPPHHPMYHGMDSYNSGVNPYDVPFNPYNEPGPRPYNPRGHPRGMGMYY